jgi:hypothetical protein
MSIQNLPQPQAVTNFFLRILILGMVLAFNEGQRFKTIPIGGRKDEND